MWRQIYDYGRQLFTLTQRTERNQEDIQQLREDFTELTSMVQILYFEFQRTKDNVKHEQENSLLRLENALLKFERRLPPAKRDDEESHDENLHGSR